MSEIFQPSMTGGELSPSLYGRVDIGRYSTALKRCRNFIVRPTGGVENRPGLAVVATVATVPDDHRLIPFVYSTEVSYTLFFGDGYIRFFATGGDVLPDSVPFDIGDTYALDAYVTDSGITYRSLQAANVGNDPATEVLWWVPDSGLQITSPWDVDQLDRVRYTQSADVMYFAHPDVPPKVLRRLTSGSFEVVDFEAKEGPFVDINTDESIKVAATGVMGAVDLESNEDIFTSNAVGSLFYMETKNLGQIKPWVPGDRGIVVGDLRRSDGKTYMAVTVPAGGTWHETGGRTPVHDNGRAWDGGGENRSNGVDTWSSGIEWEYVDSGFGVVRITSVTDGKNASGVVVKRLPAQVVGGVGSPATTWSFAGDGTSRTFPLAAAGYGVFAVTMGGVSVPPDPNYVPGPSAGGSSSGGDPYHTCVHVLSSLPGFEGVAGDVVVGTELALCDPVTLQPARGVVSVAETHEAVLWRVVTERFVTLVCSESAPIPVALGGYQTPPNLMGNRVPVMIHGAVTWDTVVDLQRLGRGAVRLITVGDRCFWAGEQPGRYILHHNIKATP